VCLLLAVTLYCRPPGGVAVPGILLAGYSSRRDVQQRYSRTASTLAVLPPLQPLYVPGRRGQYVELYRNCTEPLGVVQLRYRCPLRLVPYGTLYI